MVVGKLSIKNFKSIKKMELDCKRINIFIGEPNTGKSNILEIIGLISSIPYYTAQGFVRFETLLDLFYDRNIGDPIEIKYGNCQLKVEFKNGVFSGFLVFLTNSAMLVVIINSITATTGKIEAGLTFQ